MNRYSYLPDFVNKATQSNKTTSNNETPLTKK